MKDEPLAHRVTATLLNSAGCWHLVISDRRSQQLTTGWLKRGV